VGTVERLGGLKSDRIFRSMHDTAVVEKLVLAIDHGELIPDLQYVSSDVADWARVLVVWHQSVPDGGKLLTPSDQSHRLWFRCECMRLAELPKVARRRPGTRNARSTMLCLVLTRAWRR
jgi:hypothetical protein